MQHSTGNGEGSFSDRTFSRPIVPKCVSMGMWEGERSAHEGRAGFQRKMRLPSQSGRKFAPVYMYMGTAGFLDNSGLPEEEEIPGKVVELALLSQSDLQYAGAKKKHRKEYGPKTVEEGKPNHLTAAYLTLDRNPDTNALWDFIEENRDLLQSDGPGAD